MGGNDYSTTNNNDAAESGDDGGITTSYYLHLTLSILAIISFWAQSIITEERLVPALNVLADHHGIPDDIAGATLMAAGASSPELLCTLVSLFVTHSSLGLGTIVGSEIFNQLIICAGSVYATKSKTLVLDRKMVLREVGFYGLSIALLYVALSESRPDDANGEENDNKEYINVPFWKACLLFGGYILYVVVCAQMEFVEKCILQLFGCFKREDGMLEMQNTHRAENNIVTGVENNRSNNKTDGNVQSNYQLHLDDANNNIGLDPSAQSLATSTSLGSIHHKSFGDDDDLHQLPFIYNVTTEPVENWESSPDDEDDIIISNSSLSGDSKARGTDANNKKKKRNIISAAIHKSFKLIKANHLLCRDDYPVEINDVYELTSDAGSHEIGCFLWQRSVFYTKAYFGSHAFHLRWFTITPQRIVSVPDRQEPDKHVIVYPLFYEIHIDEQRLIIYIVHPIEGRRNFTLMAPSKAIFDAVVQSFGEYMNATQQLRLQGMVELDDENVAQAPKRDIDADPHVELIELPRNASNLELALWVSVLPLRFVMHYTLPDVRHLDYHGQPQKSVSYAYLSTISCLIWLIAGSYVMVTSLEKLADLIGIPDSIMGVTISAAGTSLPAYIASRIAAEKGFGNQAVANVFGSNTFNICIGLGLPWVIYIISIGFEPYHELENDGILESILVLTGVLLIFVVLMLSSNFVLLKWHANFFSCLYIVYIIYAVGQVYL